MKQQYGYFRVSSKIRILVSSVLPTPPRASVSCPQRQAVTNEDQC